MLSHLFRQELVIFAAAIVLQDALYTIEGASAILVVVGKQLNLALLSTTADPSLYIDIPFANVESIDHSDSQSQPLSQVSMVQKPLQYCITIRLNVSEACNIYLNARGSLVDSVTLVFDHPKDSRIVKEAMIEHCGQLEHVSLSRYMTGHTKALDISLNNVQNGESGSNDAKALSGIASNAMNAMDEEKSGLDELASEVGTHRNTLRRRHLRHLRHSDMPNESALNMDQISSTDLQINSSTLPTSPFDDRAFVAARDYTVVSAITALGKDAPPHINEPRIKEKQYSFNGLEERNDTSIGQSNSKKESAAGRVAESRSSYDPLYDVSPTHLRINHSHNRDLGRSMGDTSVKQLPSGADVNEPVKKKISQQMRNSEGQTAADSALKTSKNGIREDDMERLSRMEGRTTAASKTRSDASPQGGAIARAKSKLSKAAKNSRHPAQGAGEDDSEPSKPAPGAHNSRPAENGVQGPPSKKAKPVTTSKSSAKDASSKPKISNSQKLKSQVKYSHATKPTKRPIRDDVNYDEAFEVDDRDDRDGDAYIDVGAKRNKRQSAAAGQKKARKAPALSTFPKAGIQAVPLAKSKPRRSAAVKADKRMQGIFDDDTGEQLALEASADGSSAAPQAAEASRVARPVHNKSKLPPPSKASNPVTTPAVYASTAPHPSTPPIDDSTVAEPSVPEFTKAHAIAKTASGVEPPPIETEAVPAPEAPMRIIPSAAGNPSASAAFKDASGVSVPAFNGTSTTVQYQASPDKERERSQDLSELVEIDGHAIEQPKRQPNRQPEVIEANLGSFVESHGQILPNANNALPHTNTDTLAIQNGNDQAIVAECDASASGEQHLCFLEDQMVPEQLSGALAVATPQALSLSTAQTHFEEAMTFMGLSDDEFQREPLEEPPANLNLEPEPGNGGNQMDFKEAPNTKASKKMLSAPLFSTKPINPSTLSISKPANSSKLRSVLSVVPQLHPPADEQRANAKISASAAKARLPLMKTGMPEAKKSNAGAAEAELRIGQKRQREPEDLKRAKKSKPLLAEDHIREQRKQEQETLISTPSRRPKDIYRKPNLVHFGPTGPSNQGSSTGKPKSTAVQEDPATEPWGLETDHKTKRKRNGDVMGRPVARHEPPEKRSKIQQHHDYNRSSEYAPAPALPVKSRRADFVGQRRKPSSQSSRVDAFGSPQPYHHSRAISIARSNLASRNTVNQAFILGDDPEDENVDPFHDVPDTPYFPLTGNEQKRASPKTMPLSLISNNVKHRPSSPLASSSVIDDFTAHKEQLSGQFVDVRTAEVVVPQEPQDPFFKADDERSNSFMELLRRSNDPNAHKGKPEQGDRSVVVADVNGEDPEKTLIGAQSPDDGDSSSTSSGSDSSSGNSTSAEDDTTDDDDGAWASRWREGLRPHQTTMLDALIEISHVGKHPLEAMLLMRGSV